MVSQDMLKKLRSFQDEIKGKYHARIKGVFGSYVRGDQDGQSDLDILMDFGPEADLLDFVGVSDFLEDKMGCPIDVVPVNSIRQELKDRILAEAIYL